NLHTLIAAHPQEQNRFALGLIDGTIHVLEPLESHDRWVHKHSTRCWFRVRTNRAELTHPIKIVTAMDVVIFNLLDLTKLNRLIAAHSQEPNQFSLGLIDENKVYTWKRKRKASGHHLINP
ncbi:hypothetical protein M8C21_004674, partial [Ambrosia artemisiifolia]